MAEPGLLLVALSIALRFVHALAAGFWVGGGLLFLYVIAPLANTSATGKLTGRLGRAMSLTVGTFILTGAVLVFERLAGPGSAGAYVALLAFKMATAILAFGLVWRGGVALPAAVRSYLAGRSRWLHGRVGLAAWIGALAYLISLILQYMAENAG